MYHRHQPLGSVQDIPFLMITAAFANSVVFTFPLSSSWALLAAAAGVILGHPPADMVARGGPVRGRPIAVVDRRRYRGVERECMLAVSEDPTGRPRSRPWSCGVGKTGAQAGAGRGERRKLPPPSAPVSLSVSSSWALPFVRCDTSPRCSPSCPQSPWPTPTAQYLVPSWPL